MGAVGLYVGFFNIFLILLRILDIFGGESQDLSCRQLSSKGPGTCPGPCCSYAGTLGWLVAARLGVAT